MCQVICKVEHELREGDARKLEKSTLALVLGQVRFSPLERMDRYAPEIQDFLRKNGFPRNKSRDISEVRFESNQPPQQLIRKQWQFHDLEDQHAIILDKGFLTLQTTCYDLFDSFLSMLCDALDIVDEVVEGLIIERIGLRYVNTFTTDERGEDWRSYLQEGIRGLQSDLLRPSSALDVHQTTASTDVGTIAMRLLQNRSHRFLPPDLEFHGLSLPPHLHGVPEGCLSTIIDVDHIDGSTFPYDRVQLEERAWGLKNTTHKLTFKEIFTSHAVEQWR